MKLDTIDIPYQADPLITLRQLRTLPYLVCLDSGRPAAQDDASRYDIISACPSEIVNGQTANVESKLSDRLAKFGNDSPLPFAGGWIGYVGYEYRHTHFGIPPSATQTETQPIWFGWYDWAVIHDHEKRQSFLLFTQNCHDETKTRVQTLLNVQTTKLGAFRCTRFKSDMLHETYLNKVQQIREYIYAGDCYQVNFAHRFSATYEGDLLAAYEKLRLAVPSPYGAFLSLDNQSILSISPERFIRITDRHATTEPIKGTCKRGATPQEDERLKKELQASEKNRAENVMIVDLLRNDFSQNCEPHSVKVPQLFEIHSFANVHHLISTVEGRLKPDVSHTDFIFDCFPGGSITGAPKKRAMEIINELEGLERGPYCGAIGFFSANAMTEFNIAIRTFQQKGQALFCWGGGGIVADSDPEAEYQETHQKVDTLMRALSGCAP